VITIIKAYGIQNIRCIQVGIKITKIVGSLKRLFGEWAVNCTMAIMDI
jgi:hypothetical protein